jgi:hypothetical protein
VEPNTALVNVQVVEKGRFVCDWVIALVVFNFQLRGEISYA